MLNMEALVGLTDKQKIGAAMLTDKLNVMVAGAYALNHSPHNSKMHEAYNLMHALANRLPYPEQFNPDDVRELIKIRKDYGLEEQMRFDVLADTLHELLVFA